MMRQIQDKRDLRKQLEKDIQNEKQKAKPTEEEVK